MENSDEFAPRVLVVEDDPDMMALHAVTIDLAGFHLLAAPNGHEAVARAEEADVVLLDLMLPDVDGIDVLRVLRRRSDIPVIVVSSLDDDAHVQLAFEVGADDYVRKPFHPAELVARVRAVLRRSHIERHHVNDVDRPEPSPSAAEVEVDVGRRAVSVRGTDVPTTRREFEVLAALVSAAPNVLTRDELLDQVWGSRPEWQGLATITEHVHRLRVKIEDDPANPRHLVTVRGVGYAFHP